MNAWADVIARVAESMIFVAFTVSYTIIPHPIQRFKMCIEQSFLPEYSKWFATVRADAVVTDMTYFTTNVMTTYYNFAQVSSII